MSDTVQTAQISIELLSTEEDRLSPRAVLGGEIRIMGDKAHSDTIRVYGVRDRLVYFVLSGEIKAVSDNTLTVDFTIDFDRGLGEFSSPIATPILQYGTIRNFTTNDKKILELGLPQNLHGRLERTANQIFTGKVYRGSEIESFHIDPKSKAQVQLTLI